MPRKPKPTWVHLCEHAEEKVLERSVDEQDIKQTLYYPDRVKPVRREGLFKAERSFSSGSYKIQVVYSVKEDEYESEYFNVITVMKIKRRGGRR